MHLQRLSCSRKMRWASLPAPKIAWDAAGLPYSDEYHDRYHSSDPVGEAHYVFLQATGVQELFRAQPTVSIGELGFGSGLNFAITLEAFLRDETQAKRLIYLGIERAPWSRTDIQRFFNTLGLDVSLHELWISQLPPRAPGRYHIALMHGNKHIDLFLAQMEASDALSDFAAEKKVSFDVWYHDGFTPQKNPDIWSTQLFSMLAELSAPEARYSTFSSAGTVRRALLAAGFDVKKCKGFGRKREMLVARLVSTQSQSTRQDSTVKRVAVVGNGIAGTFAAFELLHAGHHVTQFGPKHHAFCASANPAGLSAVPRLERQWSLNMLWHFHGAAHAANFYTSLPNTLATLVEVPFVQKRRPISEQVLTEIFDDREWISVDPKAPNCINFKKAWKIAPRQLLIWFAQRMSDYNNYQPVTRTIQPSEISALANDFDAVVLCVGARAKDFAPHYSWQAIRGQVDLFEIPARAIQSAICLDDGYFIANERDDGKEIEILSGATFHPGDIYPVTTHSDTRINQDRLVECLHIQPHSIRWRAARAAVRMTARGRLPVLIQLDTYTKRRNVWLIGGLGSHGLTFAPLLARLFCNELNGLPCPVPFTLHQRTQAIVTKATHSA